MTFARVLGPTPFFLSDQLYVWIQVYCDLIGYIEQNGRLNNMAAGPKSGVSHQTLLNEVGGVWARDYVCSFLDGDLRCYLERVKTVKMKDTVLQAHFTELATILEVITLS